jgi:hypothetical protein
MSAAAASPSGPILGDKEEARTISRASETCEPSEVDRSHREERRKEEETEEANLG